MLAYDEGGKKSASVEKFKQNFHEASRMSNLHFWVIYIITIYFIKRYIFHLRIQGFLTKNFVNILFNKHCLFLKQFCQAILEH